LERPAGICIWFTGQSGGGKSTITRALVPRLEEMGRTVSVLDVVPLLRKRWWEKNSEGKLLRKAYVASQIVRHGGVAISVTVSARTSVREQAREMIGEDHFVEVLVAPPPEVAAARKAARNKKPKLGKRLRETARRLLSWLPGRGEPEKGPSRPPDVEIDSSVVPAEQAAELILAHLAERGLISSSPTRG
jgi:sulfate adenylyltransferase